MLIKGFQKTTLLDYPGKLASIVFTGGCNLRCPYCQNSELAFNFMPDNGDREPSPVSEDEVLDHLKKRRGMLEGLVITGGEPTLQKDLPDFIKKVRSLGLLIKLDTNGTNPSLKKYKKNNLTISVFGCMIPVYDIIRGSRADEDAQSVKA